MLTLYGGAHCDSGITVFYEIDDKENVIWYLDIYACPDRHLQKPFERKSFLLDSKQPMPDERRERVVVIPLTSQWIVEPICSVMFFRLELVRMDVSDHSKQVVDCDTICIQAHPSYFTDDTAEEKDISLFTSQAKDTIKIFVMISEESLEYLTKGLAMTKRKKAAG